MTENTSRDRNGKEIKIGDRVRRLDKAQDPQWGFKGKTYTVLDISNGGGLVVVAGKTAATAYSFVKVEEETAMPHPLPTDPNAPGYLIELFKHVRDRLSELQDGAFEMNTRPGVHAVPLSALENAQNLIERLNNDNKRARRENRLLSDEVAAYEQRIDELNKRIKQLRDASQLTPMPYADRPRPWRDNPYGRSFVEEYQRELERRQRASMEDMNRLLRPPSSANDIRGSRPTSFVIDDVPVDSPIEPPRTPLLDALRTGRLPKPKPDKKPRKPRKKDATAVYPVPDHAIEFEANDYD